MGFDRIMLAAAADPGPALDAFVVVAEDSLREEALELVSRLRRAGLRTDLDLGNRSVKAQFKVADRRAAKAAVLVGTEFDDGELVVRDMATGEQQQLDWEGTVRWLNTL